MMVVSVGATLHKRKSASRAITRRTTSSMKPVAIELPLPDRDATAICLIAHIDFPSSGLSHGSGAQIARPHIVPLICATTPMVPSFDNSSFISFIQRDSISSHEHFRTLLRASEAKSRTRSKFSDVRFEKPKAGIEKTDS